MSTFVSNSDQNQVAKAKKAPFKLKAVDVTTKSVLEDAVQACHKSAPFDDNDGDDVAVDKRDMGFTFYDKNGQKENAPTGRTPTVQQPAGKPADAVEHDATNDKSAKTSLVGELNDGEATVAAASIDGAGQLSMKQPLENNTEKPAEHGVKKVVEQHQGGSDESIISGSASVSKEPTDKDTEDNCPHKNTGLKTCTRPDATHHTIGGKGPLCPEHKNMGMKTRARPDGSRYTIGGKGLSKPAFSNIERAEKSDEDPFDEVHQHRIYGGKGPVKTTHHDIENAEIADEDGEMSEQDAEFSEEGSDIFDENSDMSQEDEYVSEDAENDVVGSSPTRRDMSMKSCVKPDGTRYIVGGKGLVKATDSNEVAEPSEEDSEDKIDSNSPTRSATGIKSCTKSDGSRYTVGNKGPSQTIPSHIEDAEVSGEDSDESDVDLDSDEGERQDLIKAVREEVEEKLGTIADLNQQLAAQQNVILKKRLQGKLNSLEQEMQLKLASIEDSEATGTESVDEAPQNSRKGSITKSISNTNAANGDKSIAS